MTHYEIIDQLIVDLIEATSSEKSLSSFCDNRIEDIVITKSLKKFVPYFSIKLVIEKSNAKMILIDVVKKNIIIDTNDYSNLYPVLNDAINWDLIVQYVSNYEF